MIEKNVCVDEFQQEAVFCMPPIVGALTNFTTVIAFELVDIEQGIWQPVLLDVPAATATFVQYNNHHNHHLLRMSRLSQAG